MELLNENELVSGAKEDFSLIQPLNFLSEQQILSKYKDFKKQNFWNTDYYFIYFNPAGKVYKYFSKIDKNLGEVRFKNKQIIQCSNVVTSEKSMFCLHNEHFKTYISVKSLVDFQNAPIQFQIWEKGTKFKIMKDSEDLILFTMVGQYNKSIIIGKIEKN